MGRQGKRQQQQQQRPVEVVLVEEESGAPLLLLLPAAASVSAAWLTCGPQSSQRWRMGPAGSAGSEACCVRTKRVTAD